MVNPILNFYQLNLNYLLATASEGFLNKKHDPSELSFLSAIVNGFKHNEIEMNANQRFHTYFIYLINLLTQYVTRKDEEILKQICLTLFDPNADRSSEPIVLNRFRVLICKWANYFLSENKVSDTFKCDLKDISDKITMYAPELAQNEIDEFSESILYKELSLVIGEMIYKSSTSLISQIAKNPKMNLVDNNECEIELVNQLTAKKRLRDIDIEEYIVAKKHRRENKNSQRQAKCLTDITNEEENPSPVLSVSFSLMNSESSYENQENLPEVKKRARKSTPTDSSDENIEIIKKKQKDSLNEAKGSIRRKERSSKKAIKDSDSDQENSIKDLKTPKKTSSKKATEKATKDSEDSSDSDQEISIKELKKKTPKRTPNKKATEKATKDSEDSSDSDNEASIKEVKKKTPKKTPNKNATKDSDDSSDSEQEISIKELKKKTPNKKAIGQAAESSDELSDSDDEVTTKKPSNISIKPIKGERKSLRPDIDTEVSSIKAEALSAKKRVPLRRLGDKEKYLNSSFSEPTDSESDEDKLDFNESFKRKNAFKGKKAVKKLQEILPAPEKPANTASKRLSVKLSETTNNTDFTVEDIELDTSDTLEVSTTSKKTLSGKQTKSGRKFWGDTETTYLVLGVELYGKGEWTKIKEVFGAKIDDRSTVQLKDKYRNLEKQTVELKRLKKNARKIYDSLKEEQKVNLPNLD